MGRGGGGERRGGEGEGRWGRKERGGEECWVFLFCRPGNPTIRPLFDSPLGLFSFTFSLLEHRRRQIVHCVGASGPGGEMSRGANYQSGEKSRYLKYEVSKCETAKEVGLVVCY